MTTSTSHQKKVVIVGAGFGGLKAAKYLAKDKNLSITVMDKKNHHLFQPLLYQVATAGLSPAEIAVPIRTELSRRKNVEVLMAEVKNIDTEKKIIYFDQSSLRYDFLILACGATDSYFNHPEWENFAPGLKSIEQATEIRKKILMAFELAEKESDTRKKSELLTFNIVGGGPTGVELAGAIAEISRKTLNQDFRHINPNEARIILVEGGSRVLPQFHESLSAHALENLKSMGVEVRLKSRVTHMDAHGVKIGDETIRSPNIIWAAGVKPSSIGKTANLPLDKIGRIIVTPDLSVSGHPELFVVGDLCSFEDQPGHFLPGLAPVAMQQGKHAAKQILNSLKGKERKPFHYIDKGQMATIGRSKAVLELGQIRMRGFFAWVAWLFVHIYYLIGFKNKYFVFFSWAWSYLTFKRGARLIVEDK